MALQKTIKVKRLITDGNALPDGTLLRTFSAWLIDDKIRVIGFELSIDINESGLTGLEEGTDLFGVANLTKSQGLEDTAVLGAVVARRTLMDVTIGVASFLAHAGTITRDIVVMWPEGYGQDFEVDDYLYLGLDGVVVATPNPGGLLYCAARAYIYYVER